MIPETPTFSHERLQTLEDVFDGAPLGQAQATLAALGFESLRHVEMKDTLLHTWVHPAGVVVTGYTGTDGNQVLNTMRLSALCNFGWGQASEAAAFGRGAKMVELDGQLFAQANPSLHSQSVSLLRCLNMLEHRAQLQPFDRWLEFAQEGKAQSWLFAVGNLALKELDEAVGVSTWLDSAPEALRAFVEKRLEDITRSMTATRRRPWEEETVDYVRKVAREAGITKPTEDERRQLLGWMNATTAKVSGRKDNPGLYDFHRHRTGLTQASILAHNLASATAQNRLLQWIERAPEDTLRRAVAAPQADGHHLPSLLIKALVTKHDATQSNKPPTARSLRTRPVGEVVIQAFENLIEKLGSETVSLALNQDGNAMGLVLGSLRSHVNGQAAPPEWKNLPGDVAKLIQALESGGVDVELPARLATVHRVPREPSEVVNLALALKEAHGAVDWKPLTAWLNERHLQVVLAEPEEPSSRKPKSRL